jgi:conjugal transfer mating pair stabilization protein TraG
VTSSASGISSSITEAQTFSREARRYFETAERIEASWSVRNGEGVAGSLNTSDAFLEFARGEIATTPLVYKEFDPANAVDWHSNDPQVALERDLLISKYVEHAGVQIRAEVEAHLVEPDANGLLSPMVSSAHDVAARGASGAERIPDSGGGATDHLRERMDDVRKAVSEAQVEGREQIASHRDARAGDTAGAGDLGGGAEKARDWGRTARAVPDRR